VSRTDLLIEATDISDEAAKSDCDERSPCLMERLLAVPAEQWTDAELMEVSSDEIRHHLRNIEHHVRRLSAPATELGTTHTSPLCTELHVVQAPDSGESQSRILKPGGGKTTPRDTVSAQRAGGEPPDPGGGKDTPWDRVSDPAKQAGKSKMRKIQPTIKPPIFTGEGSLEIFLAKMKNCAKYYEWSDCERICHLKAALHGTAAQLLWQLADDATEGQIVDILRKLLGDICQQERYRFKLNTRRRREGESLQDLASDIRRLMFLSYPGESGSLFDIIGRDVFLRAINNVTLRIKILELNAKTLDQTLMHASRLEGYNVFVSKMTENSTNVEEGRRSYACMFRSETHGDERVSQLESDVRSLRSDLDGIKDNANKQYWRDRALKAEQNGWGPRDAPQNTGRFLPPSISAGPQSSATSMRGAECNSQFVSFRGTNVSVVSLQCRTRTFECPFCSVVKHSRVAFRTHLGLHHGADFRLLRQKDGRFRSRVVRLVGDELERWTDRCRRSNGHYGPRRKVNGENGSVNREANSPKDSPLSVTSSAVSQINSEQAGNSASSESPMVTASIGLPFIAICLTELPTVCVENLSTGTETFVKTPVREPLVQVDNVVVDLSVQNAGFPVDPFCAEYTQSETQACDFGGMKTSVETSADRFTGLSEPVTKNVPAGRAEVVDFGLPVDLSCKQPGNHVSVVWSDEVLVDLSGLKWQGGDHAGCSPSTVIC